MSNFEITKSLDEISGKPTTFYKSHGFFEYLKKNYYHSRIEELANL
jgi:hypothetical protein